MIQLAMELPTSKLPDWAPLADLDFVLAHQVLEDEAYAKFFHDRPEGRELILDNSLHELGYPLELEKLQEAAKRCRATYVIAPDKVGDEAFNADNFVRARDHFYNNGDPEFLVAVVMTGAPNSTIAQREMFLETVRDADMLCVSFKYPQRLAWFLASEYAQTFWNRIHLLGVDTLQELQLWAALDYQWRTFPHSLSAPKLSVDTGKAFKRAMQYELLSQTSNWRGSRLHSKDLLNVPANEITPKIEELFKQNVETLREALELR